MGNPSLFWTHFWTTFMTTFVTFAHFLEEFLLAREGSGLPGPGLLAILQEGQEGAESDDSALFSESDDSAPSAHSPREE